MQLRKKLGDLADRTRESGDWDEFVWTSTCALSWAYSFWSSDQRIKTQRSRLRCNHNIPEIVQVASHKKRWVLRSVKQQFLVSKHAGKRPRRAKGPPARPVCTFHQFHKGCGCRCPQCLEANGAFGSTLFDQNCRLSPLVHILCIATPWPSENESHWIPFIFTDIHHISSHLFHR